MPATIPASVSAASSASAYPSIRAAGQVASKGSLDVPEGTLWSGSGSQTGSYNRWGDYTQLVTDPDGCTFWYTGEYYATTGNAWRTLIGSFKLPGCV